LKRGWTAIREAERLLALLDRLAVSSGFRKKCLKSLSSSIGRRSPDARVVRVVP
jgi:hypothetical protein